MAIQVNAHSYAPVSPEVNPEVNLEVNAAGPLAAVDIGSNSFRLEIGRAHV